MTKLSRETIIKVCAFWELHNDDDCSTERLLEMCRQENNLKDVSEVIDALRIGGMLTEVKE